MEKDNPNETLPVATDPKPDEPAGGEGTSPDPSDTTPKEVASIKDVIGETLGKTFETDEAALKSIKDTQSFVGKKVEAVKPVETPTKSGEPEPAKVPAKEFVTKEEYDKNLFFAQNPDYNKPELKPVIESLVATTGESIEEVIKSETVKAIVEKITAHDKDAEAKSVLKSGNKLGTVTDKGQEALDALKEVNKAKQAGDHNAENAFHSVASDKAIDAVNDLFPTEQAQKEAIGQR